MSNEYFIPLKEDLSDKKILIVCPFYEHKGYCTNSYFENIRNLVWKNKDYFFIDTSNDLDFFEVTKEWCKDEFKFIPEWFHVPFVDTSRKRQVFAYNKIREYFLAGNWDYLFIVESDLFPHEHIIPLLMRWNRDVISAAYRIGMIDKYKKMCVTTDAQTLYANQFGANFMKETDIDGMLRRIGGGCGFGCILIKRKVIEKIKFRSDILHADSYFHEDCEKYGFERWVDTSQVIPHYPSAYFDF